MIDRSPRAPVLRSMAFREIAQSASSGRIRRLGLPIHLKAELTLARLFTLPFQVGRSIGYGPRSCSR